MQKLKLVQLTPSINIGGAKQCNKVKTYVESKYFSFEVILFFGAKIHTF